MAKIVPAGRAVAERDNAKPALLEHLREQPVQNLGITSTRDELYDG